MRRWFRLDGQAATLHVGSRYPIITNTYVGNTAGSVGTVYTPPPTVNYEDLGLVLKVTPSLHDGGEMTLDLDTEFKVLGAQTSSGIPIIANRKYHGESALEGRRVGRSRGSGSGHPFRHAERISRLVASSDSGPAVQPKRYRKGFIRSAAGAEAASHDPGAVGFGSATDLDRHRDPARLRFTDRLPVQSGDFLKVVFRRDVLRRAAPDRDRRFAVPRKPDDGCGEHLFFRRTRGRCGDKHSRGCARSLRRS